MQKCNMDCFHCPYKDCINGDAKQTAWEKQVYREFALGGKGSHFIRTKERKRRKPGDVRKNL